MKKLIIAIAAFTFLSAFTTMQKKQRILFFGDSITQAGVGPTGYIPK